MKQFLLKLKLSFYFYTRLWLISILLTFILCFLGNIVEVILAVKLFLLSLIFLENRFLSAQDRFLFYKNFGISIPFLFGSVFCMDFITSVLIFKITRLFL